jgi:hypothetical protein
VLAAPPFQYSIELRASWLRGAGRDAAGLYCRIHVVVWVVEMVHHEVVSFMSFSTLYWINLKKKNYKGLKQVLHETLTLSACMWRELDQ